MYKSLLVLAFALCLMACGGDAQKANTVPTTTAPKAAAKTQQPIRVTPTNTVNTPPPSVVQSSNSPKGAPLGSITNPIVKGLPAPVQRQQQPPGGIVRNQPVKKPEPPQNDKGVWHFICSATGCQGGAGQAEACKTCGKMLTHNQAYHQ